MINVCAIAEREKMRQLKELMADPMCAIVAGECCGLYAVDESRQLVLHKQGGYLPHGYVAVPVVFA